jgi:beta-mannosidase
MIKIINDGWKFRQARSNNWYQATVPGTVHTDLFANQLIEDPFFRLNERNLQWIDKEDWIYETKFALSEAMLKQENIDFVFNGLDTYADVYINDSLVLNANNMFRTWRVQAKKYIRQGDNTLRIYFNSPVKVDVPKWDALPYHYEASNDQSENGGLFDKKISVFARKAGYHYGWDWGPRLVTSGIWRPINIEAWSTCRIANLFINQKEVTSKKAVIDGLVTITATNAGKATVAIADATSGKMYGKQIVTLAKGNNKIHIGFAINNPKLWWSNGLGEPHLYQFKATITSRGNIVDTNTVSTGIRSLKVINKPDKDGHTFYVELNGRSVFMKGANYIPLDNFLPRVTPERYAKLIQDAKESNLNMLRIWGGGIYEEDLFYNLCDKNGILVWQDFMFACSLYPAEGKLLDNIRWEAIDNVVRLRNHPCMALWCGNNECNDAWYGWGWKKRYEEQNPEYAQIIRKQYESTYNKVLPEVVKEYAPETFYWPSSPFANNDGMSNDHDGDRHYWSVWHGKKPIEDYNIERSRFFSEYGFQSFPDYESVLRYAPEGRDHDIYSDVMMAHQRGGDHANSLINTYLLSEYQKPKDFESFLYMNQVLQGDAIKTAIESHRRQMPYCMGTLYWQIDDCWPVASWSSIDYYGRWKAQQFYCKKAYRDILISPLLNGSKLNISIVSDRIEVCKGTLDVQFINMQGKVIDKSQVAVAIEPNNSKIYLSLDIDKLLRGTPRNEVVIVAQLKGIKDSDYCNHYFLVKQKDMNYPKASITHILSPIEGGYRLTLKADNFARAAYISTGDAKATFSDNFMDIIPGKTVTVDIKTQLSKEKLLKGLKIISLKDAY